MEDHLQQEVAELVAEPVGIARVDGLQRLVRLLQQMAAQGLVGLFEVPGTPARTAQPMHHPQQVQDPVAGGSRWNGRAGNVGEGVGMVGLVRHDLYCL
jgi:hypothetical protein